MKSFSICRASSTWALSSWWKRADKWENVFSQRKPYQEYPEIFISREISHHVITQLVMMLPNLSRLFKMRLIKRRDFFKIALWHFTFFFPSVSIVLEQTYLLSYPLSSSTLTIKYMDEISNTFHNVPASYSMRNGNESDDEKPLYLWLYQKKKKK